MDIEELYDFLRCKFERVIEDNGLGGEPVLVHPLRAGILKADFRGSEGLACTNLDVEYSGTVEEVCRMETVENEKTRAIFISVLNAVMVSLGLAVRNSICREGGQEFCGENIADYVASAYGNPEILLVGMQEGILSGLRKKGFSVSVIGDEVKPSSGDLSGTDLILCSGSTIITGTITDYLDLDKEVIFYGMTLAGAAEWLGVKRICF